MPEYGWTHQPACVQTCLVCSLICNSRVPCSQPWFRLEGPRFQSSICTHASLVAPSLMRKEFRQSSYGLYVWSRCNLLLWEKELFVGSYVIWILLSVVKLVCFMVLKNKTKQECCCSPCSYSRCWYSSGYPFSLFSANYLRCNKLVLTCMKTHQRGLYYIYFFQKQVQYRVSKLSPFSFAEGRLSTLASCISKCLFESCLLYTNGRG